jgi:hypothetical protein
MPERNVKFRVVEAFCPDNKIVIKMTGNIEEIADIEKMIKLRRPKSIEIRPSNVRSEPITRHTCFY